MNWVDLSLLLLFGWGACGILVVIGARMVEKEYAELEDEGRMSDFEPTSEYINLPSKWNWRDIAIQRPGSVITISVRDDDREIIFLRSSGEKFKLSFADYYIIRDSLARMVDDATKGDI